MIVSLLCGLVLAPNIYRDLVYVGGGGKSQSLDLYVPEGAGKKPLVIWIHGGWWRSGNKSGGPIQPLLREGLAVASINYRFSSEAIFPAQIYDCKAAVRWLRANAERYGLDKEKFGAWGGSSGGYLAALLGTSGGVKELEGDLGNLGESSRVQAVCDFYGPIDFAAMMTGSAGSESRNSIALLLGGAVSSKLDLAKTANPVTYVSRDDPPFLICHGGKDALVPLSQSATLHQALQSAGVSSELFVAPNGSHGNIGAEANEKAVAFFKAQL